MSKDHSQAKSPPAYFSAPWFQVLKNEIAASNITKVAEKIGVARTSLSVFMNGSGLYGSGKASPRNMEIRFRQAYEKLSCPHTQKQVGIEHCRAVALCSPPNHNPLKMMQWQACQQCQYKPQPAAQQAAEAQATPQATSQPTTPEAA